MSEKFTNRHGRTVAVENDVEDDVLREITPTQYEVAVPQQELAQKRRLPWKRIGLVLLGLVVFCIALGELTTAIYKGSVSSARKNIANITATDISPLQQEEAVSAATLDAIVKKYTAVSKSLCPGGILDNFALLYPRSSAALTDCTVYRSTVQTLVGALGGLQEEAAYLEKLPSVLSPATQPLADQFAVLGSQQENWQSIANGLKDITTPTQLRAGHSALVQAAEFIASDWTALVNATNTRDSAAFTAGQEKLASDYEAFRAQADVIQAAVTATQADLTNAANAL